MKAKQPDHCAHVAQFYADKADTMAYKPSSSAFGYISAFKHPEYSSPADPVSAIRYLKSSMANLRLAIKFWLRAGGVPGRLPGGGAS